MNVKTALGAAVFDSSKLFCPEKLSIEMSLRSVTQSSKKCEIMNLNDINRKFSNIYNLQRIKLAYIVQ